MDEERSDALADEPTTEDFLDFGRLFVNIVFKQSLSHRFNIDKALAEAPRNIMGEDASLVTFE